MKALDTNVLVRYLLRDDARQAEIAGALLAAGNVFLPVAVVLELIWVLKSRGKLDFARVSSAIASVADLPGIAIEAADDVAWALTEARSTNDLADLLLLVSARSCETFVTFDARIAKVAGEGGPIAVELVR